MSVLLELEVQCVCVCVMPDFSINKLFTYVAHLTLGY